MANVVCGLDKDTCTTWFAFNKKTGNFACLTNFRTQMNKVKKDYDSRGRLVLEYVMIDDEDIFEGDRQTMEGFLEKLRCDTYKGFNLLFGNIFNRERRLSDHGALKVYQDQNWLERPSINKRPVIAMR